VIGSSIVTPAIRYKQGGRQFYAGAFEVGAILRLTEMEHPVRRGRTPEEVRNRPYSRKHMEGIVEYLRDEPSYILGAITLTVEPGSVRFVPDAETDQAGLAPVSGKLYVPIDIRFWVEDGQHRLYAFERLLDGDGTKKLVDRVRRDSVPVVIVEERDLFKIQQDFVDMQRNAKVVSPAIAAAFNRREPINRVARSLVDRARFLTGRVEFFKTTVGKRGHSLFTINQVRSAAAIFVLGSLPQSWREVDRLTRTQIPADKIDETAAAIAEYLETLAPKVDGWAQFIDGNPFTQEIVQMRDTLVSLSATVFVALAGVAGLAKRNRVTPEDLATRLSDVSWSRSSEVWRDLVPEGKMRGGTGSINFAFNTLKKIAKL
jgi:DGQHR domain-containing protein